MRTRFPPSPTGFLHVGGLRTALYSYLLAKQEGSEFILRIEDTDQERSVEGAVDNILRTLHWAGLDPDEGVMMRDQGVVQEGGNGPYIQSERLEIYKEYAQKLLESGHAYPCFCTSERLDQMRKDQQARKEPPMYDRHCLTLSEEEIAERIEKGEPHVLRLKVPKEETVTFEDDIRGAVEFKGHTIDDQVLMKSDGFPTYHLAHVVDDHLMKVDLVLRGEEWLSSLPKHILLFRAFGWDVPRYAHVPLLLNKDKSKLSKRQNDVAAEDYIQKGYLPEALLNFLALMGWNPGTEQEVFSMTELLEAFSLDRVQKSGAIFDTDKLDWLQGQWMRKMPPEEFADNIKLLVTTEHPEAESDPEFPKKAALIQDRITFFPEAPAMLGYFYSKPEASTELIANPKQKVTPEMIPEIVALLIGCLEAVSENDWTEDQMKEALFALAEEKELKKGQILWPLRAILTGQEYSPGAFEVAAILGKEETLKRLQNMEK